MHDHPEPGRQTAGCAAVTTMGVMTLAARWTRAVPAAILALAAGMLVYVGLAS